MLLNKLIDRIDLFIDVFKKNLLPKYEILDGRLM